MLIFPAYHKGIETLLHVHFISFLKVAEIDFVVFGIEIVFRQLIKRGRHICESLEQTRECAIELYVAANIVDLGVTAAVVVQAECG